MLNIDAIESINFEQLATVTDRLLLRGGTAKRRPTAQRIAIAATNGTDNARAPNELWRRFTTTALLTALFSVSAAIASLL
jgi:hypothetical protein